MCVLIQPSLWISSIFLFVAARFILSHCGEDRMWNWSADVSALSQSATFTHNLMFEVQLFPKAFSDTVEYQPDDEMQSKRDTEPHTVCLSTTHLCFQQRSICKEAFFFFFLFFFSHFIQGFRTLQGGQRYEKYSAPSRLHLAAESVFNESEGSDLCVVEQGGRPATPLKRDATQLREWIQWKRTGEPLLLFRSWNRIIKWNPKSFSSLFNVQYNCRMSFKSNNRTQGHATRAALTTVRRRESPQCSAPLLQLCLMKNHSDLIPALRLVPARSRRCQPVHLPPAPGVWRPGHTPDVHAFRKRGLCQSLHRQTDKP